MNLFITFADYCYAAFLKIGSYFYDARVDELKKGSQPTAIIIPGVYETPLYFKKISQTLSSTHNVIHAYSIYGKSSGIDADSRAIATYIADNGLKNVLLVGHSSGGLTAGWSLRYSKRISKVIAIAAPFHGTPNGYFLRTKVVRELLPTSKIIQAFAAMPTSDLEKITSIYPTFDNQVWSRKGSRLEGAKNVQIRPKGHHLILQSDDLQRAIRAEI